MANTNVKPTLPGGFRDYSPSQMLARLEMIRTIEGVYRRFGFVPLQTSIVQMREVLTGNEPSGMRMWDTRVDAGQENVSEVKNASERTTLRFDLTVPLARYVAENMKSLRFPFRRYEYGYVYRGESPQAGRYCGFMQFDIDIVGARTGAADAEIIFCMAEVMKALGISRFLIKVNNRKILNGFAELLGLNPASVQAKSMFRIMDKADKIGINGVCDELAKPSMELGETVFTGLSDDQIAKVKQFMTLVDGVATNTDRLAALRTYLTDSKIGIEGVQELEFIATFLASVGMTEAQWVLDPSIARGLGYYTGPVFETALLDKPEFGSVFSGGRFDDLVSRFTGESLPSVGTSAGVDRLFAALEILKTVKEPEPEVDVFIVNMSPALVPEYFKLAQELRAEGLRAEIFMGHQDNSIKVQTGTGIARRAPFIIYFGQDEVTKGTVQVKNTKTRAQVSLPRADVSVAIAKMVRGEA